jgi:hypothetical protein
VFLFDEVEEKAFEFLIFCGTFLFFVANLISRQPRSPTYHLFKSDIKKSSCLAKLKKRHSMEIESKFIGPSLALHI